MGGEGGWEDSSGLYFLDRSDKMVLLVISNFMDFLCLFMGAGFIFFACGGAELASILGVLDLASGTTLTRLEDVTSVAVDIIFGSITLSIFH